MIFSTCGRRLIELSLNRVVSVSDGKPIPKANCNELRLMYEFLKKKFMQVRSVLIVQSTSVGYSNIVLEERNFYLVVVDSVMRDAHCRTQMKH